MLLSVNEKAAQAGCTDRPSTSNASMRQSPFTATNIRNGILGEKALLFQKENLTSQISLARSEQVSGAAVAKKYQLRLLVQMLAPMRLLAGGGKPTLKGRKKEANRTCR